MPVMYMPAARLTECRSIVSHVFASGVQVCAAAHTWTPDAKTWETIERHSVSRAAGIYITGIPRGHKNKGLSLGRVTIETSKDPVGAPIFYRDVPLMPSEVEKGVIKP